MQANPRGIPFNLPYLCALSLILAGGQLLYLKYFAFPTPLELTLLAMTVLAHVFALVLALATVLGFVTPRLGQRTGDAVLGLVLSLSALVFVDFLSFGWLSLHLNDTFSMLLWCLRTDFLVMQDKQAYVVPAALGALGLFAAATYFSHRTRKAPGAHLWIAPRRLVRLWVGVGIGVGGTQLACRHYLRPQILERQQEALWQLPLVPMSAAPLKRWADPRFVRLVSDEEIQRKLASGPKGTGPRPDIYLFVLESFRADAVTPELAPNLSRLAAEALPIEHALAAANCTHISWNSLMTGLSPLHWRLSLAARKKPGSNAMRLLKRLGYELSVLSTPSMDYFGAGQTFFGTPSLASAITDQQALLKDAGKDEIGALDEAAGKRLVAAAGERRAGAPRFQTIFLDSTHHQYYWPESFAPKFKPFAPETMDVFRTTYSAAEVEALRNRYRNAVSFLDEQIGRFVEALEKSGRLEESIIVVTGDHGEEFNERGNLVHSSELNRFQTRVPLIVRLPKALRDRVPPQIALASHSDLFPTLFDLLGEKEMAAGLLHGRSLLDATSAQLPLVAQCASETPRHLILDRGADKAVLVLQAPWGRGQEIHARSLDLVGFRGPEDEPLFPKPEERSAALAHWEAHYAPALAALFEP